MEEQKGIGETSEKHRNNSRDDLNDTQKQILKLLSQDVQLSAKKMAEILNLISKNLKDAVY